MYEMEDRELFIAVATSLMVVCSQGNERKRRRMWAKTWLRRREEKSAYNNIIAELRLEDKEHFRHYLRMNTTTFEVRDCSNPTFKIMFYYLVKYLIYEAWLV